MDLAPKYLSTEDKLSMVVLTFTRRASCVTRSEIMAPLCYKGPCNSDANLNS